MIDLGIISIIISALTAVGTGLLALLSRIRHTTCCCCCDIDCETLPKESDINRVNPIHYNA